MSKLCCLWKFVLMWSVVMTSWQRWMLARLWCKWHIDVVSWQRRVLAWCHGKDEVLTWFLAKTNVGMTSVQMKFWRGFMNVGTTLVRMKYWRSFMAKMNVGMVSVQILVQLQCECKSNVECCYGFMAKMNVGTASVQMMVRLHSRCKYKYCFLAKMNVGMASIQGRMLARIHGKDF